MSSSRASPLAANIRRGQKPTKVAPGPAGPAVRRARIRPPALPRAALPAVPWTHGNQTSGVRRGRRGGPAQEVRRGGGPARRELHRLQRGDLSAARAPPRGRDTPPRDPPAVPPPRAPPA